MTVIESESADRRILDELRGFEHDVVHQLSTIRVLAELVGRPDLPAAQRQLRARQLTREIRWLRRFVVGERSRLLRRHGGAVPDDEIRLDVLMADVMATTKVMTAARVQLVVEPVRVCADRIALGRALRNLIWNAIDAAGPRGEVQAAVRSEGDAAVVEIENDVHDSVAKGKGIGLDVVRGVVSDLDGTLRIETGVDSHRVTLRLPLAVRRDERCAS
jgi:signal transduction histidine kinase